MGVSWYHEVYVVCDGNPTQIDDERWYDVPVTDQSVDGNILHFTSGGYGIFPLFTSDTKLPNNWVKVSHRIYGCQGQDFDVVDWVSKSEIDDLYSDVDKDENGEYEYEPGYEYTDVGSDYWEGNSHLNVYNSEPDVYDDEYDERYQLWYESMKVNQIKDLIMGIK